MPSVHDSRLLIWGAEEKSSYLSVLSGDERREIEELLQLTSGFVWIYFDESRNLFASHLVCVHVEVGKMSCECEWLKKVEVEVGDCEDS